MIPAIRNGKLKIDTIEDSLTSSIFQLLLYLPDKMLLDILKNTLDITDWLEWFLACLYRTLDSSDAILSKVLFKHACWTKWAKIPLNDRQSLMLNKLLDGFKGKLNTSKWAKIATCSNDTALRDIQDLVKKGILIKEDAGGRSTSYVLNDIH